MRTLKILLLAVLAIGPLTGMAQSSGSQDHSGTVREFLDAFNSQDARAMAALVADDIKWFSVNGSTVSTELEGKETLAAAMEDYFSSCPSCRSEITELISSGQRVSVVEVASWTGKDGQRSQQSLAVYEFSGSLIKGVYYFPEEAGSTSK